jgi:choline dehydrogenase-like flavoprotein
LKAKTFSAGPLSRNNSKTLVRAGHPLGPPPFTHEPYYAKAEDKMGVTRTNGIPGLPGNNNFKVMKAGADKLGYKECHTGRMAINSQERDGRNSCQQTGFCFQGCKWGAKWSTLYTEIPKAEKTGNMEVRPESHVAQIEHDASGKVTGVTYFDADGKLQRQKARIVAVAGNSLESPRLLLNSASAMFPDGLANSSGQVGRNYMRHTTGSVYAVFEHVRAIVFKPASGFCKRFQRTSAFRPVFTTSRKWRSDPCFSSNKSLFPAILFPVRLPRELSS